MSENDWMIGYVKKVIRGFNELHRSFVDKNPQERLQTEQLYANLLSVLNIPPLVILQAVNEMIEEKEENESRRVAEK